MWIILIRKLPVENAPPALSMFWSTWFPPAIGWYRPTQRLLDMLPNFSRIGAPLSGVNYKRRLKARKSKSQ